MAVHCDVHMLSVSCTRRVMHVACHVLTADNAASSIQYQSTRPQGNAGGCFTVATNHSVVDRNIPDAAIRLFVPPMNHPDV